MPPEPRYLRRSSLERLLDKLEQPDARVTWTAYVSPLTPLSSLGPGYKDPPLPPELEEVTGVIGESETGAAVFWGPSGGHVVLPPFPLSERSTHRGMQAAPLRALLKRELRLGVVLVRLGGYSIGVFQGERLLVSKTGQRYVKGGHRAGGSSAARFARIRERQARELFDEVCEVVRTRLSPYEATLDYVVLGGARVTLTDFVERCQYMQRLAPKTLGRILDVREPRLAVLEAAPELIWTSRVYVLQPVGGEDGTMA